MLFDVYHKLDLKSYSDFRDVGQWISDDVVISFYKKYYSTNFSPFYHLIPTFNAVGKVGKNFKYIIFENGVLVTYKCIKIFKTSQIRVFNKPISLKGNVDDENKVKEYLNNLDFIKYAVSDSALIPDQAELLYVYRDYYYDFTENLKHKWLQRHKVNYFLTNADYSYDIFYGNSKKYDKEALLTLYDRWKWNSGYYITKSREQEFKNIVFSDNTNVIKSIIYYKNEPICLDACIVDKNINTCISVGIVHLARDAWMVDKAHSKVLNNLMNIERYILQEFLKPQGITRVYIAGVDKNTSLDEHKLKTCDGYIDYYLCERI